MNIKTVQISTLEFDAENARKHSNANIESIKHSLTKFGQRKPIIVHKGTVIAGNGTLQAAMELDWTQITISEVPEDWSDDTAKAYALADNRSSELAEWDNSILAAQLLELDEMGWDVTELGFTQTANGEPVDAHAEWENMPEFEQNDRNSVFHTTVHFKSDTDADSFFSLIGQNKKTSLWYPESDGLVGSDVSKRYVSE